MFPSAQYFLYLDANSLIGDVFKYETPMSVPSFYSYLVQRCGTDFSEDAFLAPRDEGSLLERMCMQLGFSDPVNTG